MDEMKSIYELHDITNIFPPMSNDEYNKLVEDMRENGQQEPIWLYDGKVIDGRNRCRACEELGIEPKTQNWDGEPDELIKFVTSLNLHRRHLTSSQRAAAAVQSLELLKAEAKTRQREAGGKAVSQKIDEPEITKPAPAAPGKDDARGLAIIGNRNATLYDFVGDPNAGRATERAAKAFGTNRQYVETVVKLRSDQPEQFEAVKRGDLSISDANLLKLYIDSKGNASDLGYGKGPDPDHRGTAKSIYRRVTALSLSLKEQVSLAKLGKYGGDRDDIEVALDAFEADEGTTLKEAISIVRETIKAKKKADEESVAQGERERQERLEREWKERDPLEHFAHYLLDDLRLWERDEVEMLKRHLKNCKLTKLAAAVDSLVEIYEASP